MKAGYSSQRSAAERKVDSASSTPACQRHSQTGSTWALPIMCTIMVRFSLLLKVRPRHFVAALHAFDDRLPAAHVEGPESARQLLRHVRVFVDEVMRFPGVIDEMIQLVGLLAGAQDQAPGLGADTAVVRAVVSGDDGLAQARPLATDQRQ